MYFGFRCDIILVISGEIMKKLLTIIFDGFGYREETKGNAVRAAQMPNFNALWENYPHALLGASEEAVGLKAGQVGNSEVGHSTIGAGKVLKQNEILVDEFFAHVDLENESIKKLLALKDKDIHIMGLCSDGNVHAGVDDFLNMFAFLHEHKFTKIHFHLITDGRDTATNVAYKYIKMIETAIKKYKVGDIASVCGRYYAMDRDENWDRTKLYYDLVVNGKGALTLNLEASLQKSYQAGVTDEFIKPILVSKNTLKDGDVLIWMNYRADRSKQILMTFNEEFTTFPVHSMPNLTTFTLFNIDKKIKSNAFLEPTTVEQPLGIYLSELGLTQARVAESEKYPHVTYFFDGGYNGKIEKCDKFHIPSPEVATYDELPEMSAYNVTKKVITCMENDYDFILVNYANPDMVGHTGYMEATIKACETVDLCLGKLIEKAEENFYKIILLADHGNADTMLNADGTPCTTHSLAKVPFIVMDNKVGLQPTGTLANVAPTILDYLDIAVAKGMSGEDTILIDGD